MSRGGVRRLLRGAFSAPAGAAWACLLTVALSLYAVPSAFPPSPGIAGSSTVQDRDALWIAVANQDDGRTLVPIARYLEGSWDNAPWADLLSMEGIEAVKTGDGVWGWPDAREYWGHPGRAVDTLGWAPGLIAAGVPLSWLLYSPGEEALPLSTKGLVVAQAHCLNRWAVRTDRDPPAASANADPDDLPGIAFTRTPSAVLAQEEIPGLERIRRDLGFADVSEGRKGDRSFLWLGLFRFGGIATGDPDGPPESTGGAPQGTTLGVLWGLYYEGAEYIVIRIDGDRSSVLVRTSEGGC